ncbi:MAG TPA: ABC transporter ATP-binding protein [Bacillota bacterium]|nr:ABC transporter ATP-binding protein [Bacillota bacterium]
MVNLSVRKLVKDFAGGTRAVDGIDFDVPAGTLFTLLGPSGCGKTTTLRMVAGLESPTSGSILFGNEDYTRFPPHKRNIGMVFQSYALYPHMSVFENVAYGLRVRTKQAEEVKSKVGKALELVGLSHTAARRPSQLSGGQQQRIALARALVYDPALLLLDEPLSNLDAKLRIQMREEIRRIQKAAGATTLYVTHDQEEALSISDVVAVIHSGRISQIGKPHDVYEKPASALVADFIGRANFIKCLIVGKQGAGRTVKVAGSTITVGCCVGDQASFNAGDEALLFFRPEKAALSTSPVEGRSVPCVVRQVLYLGESVRYTTELPTKEVVQLALNRRAEGIDEGSSANIVLEASDLRIFPMDQYGLIKRGN